MKMEIPSEGKALRSLIHETLLKQIEDYDGSYNSLTNLFEDQSGIYGNIEHVVKWAGNRGYHSVARMIEAMGHSKTRSKMIAGKLMKIAHDKGHLSLIHRGDIHV
jgi:hypothetical protein